MGLLRILAIATTVEICAVLAVLAALAAGGAIWDWLDLVNTIAPLFIPLGVAAAVVAWAILPSARSRIVCAGLALAAALYGVFMTTPNLVQSALPRRAVVGALPFRLVSANVFAENPSPFSAAKSLIARGADAVIVAEADGTIQRARAVLASAYPSATHCDASGVQIWLKTPIVAEGCGLFTPPAWHPTWGQGFVWAKTLGPDGKPIVVVATHLARPYPPTRQSLERGSLPAALAALGPDRVILAGDFNTVPWTFAMHKLDRAVAPLHRLTHWLPTYPAQINLMMAPWSLPLLPIDHVYAGRQWSGSGLTRFRVPGSDHFAVEVQAALTN
jgi:endonuclease/exonuclease/phosphatase (EEP) superfamily protein YafD